MAIITITPLGALDWRSFTQIKRPGKTTFSARLRSQMPLRRREARTRQQQVPSARARARAARVRQAQAQPLREHRRAAAERSAYWKELEKAKSAEMAHATWERQFNPGAARRRRQEAFRLNISRTLRAFNRGRAAERYHFLATQPEPGFTIQPSAGGSIPGSGSQKTITSLPAFTETRIEEARERLGIEGVYF
jgi:hypothetical protein